MLQFHSISELKSQCSACWEKGVHVPTGCENNKIRNEQKCSSSSWMQRGMGTWRIWMARTRARILQSVKPVNLSWCYLEEIPPCATELGHHVDQGGGGWIHGIWLQEKKGEFQCGGCGRGEHVTVQAAADGGDNWPCSLGVLSSSATALQWVFPATWVKVKEKLVADLSGLHCRSSALAEWPLR